MSRIILWCVVAIFAGLIGAYAQNPIFICGDQALAEYGHRLPGDGSIENPYILAYGSLVVERADYGLWIENTRSHLIIESWSISGVLSPNATGAIVLRNCQNVVIRNCLLRENRTALSLQRSTNIRVENNTLVGNEFGIVLDMFAEGNTFIGNQLENCINAQASRPNSWSDGERGNCWSDFDGYSSTYWISQGNLDRHPSSLDTCPVLADTLPPVFLGSTSGVFEIESGSEPVEHAEFICAQDDVDGKVVCGIPLSEIDPCRLDQEQRVTIEACDESGNCIAKEIRVRFIDTTPPRILFDSSNPLILDRGESAESLLTRPILEDECNRNVSLKLDASQLDSCTLGEYDVDFIATDPSGNTTRLSKLVRVVDSLPPQITLLGDNPLLLELNGLLRTEDPGVIVTEVSECEFQGTLNVTYNSVDSSEPGVYELRYQACDRSQNCAEATRQVIVGLGAPPQLPEELPLGPAIASWELVDSAIQCIIQVGQLGPGTYLNQLYFGEILKAIALQIPPIFKFPLQCRFIDPSGGQLMDFRLRFDSWSQLSTHSSSLDILLTNSGTVGIQADKGWYWNASHSAEDARARAEALVRYMVEGPRIVLVRAHIETYDAPMQFYVDVSYFKNWTLSSSLLDVLRNQTETLAIMIQRALHGFVRTAISVLDDDYGLLYRGMKFEGTNQWVEGYVHPSL